MTKFLEPKTGTRSFQTKRYNSHLTHAQVRADMENRARLDRDMDEIADMRKQVDDLKYLLNEK